MFTEETIRKYIVAMKEAVEEYSRRDKPLKISISPGNDKIGWVPNISLPPILSCPHCAQCMHWCYDMRDCFRYGWNFMNGPAAARAKNWVIYKNSPEEYFGQLFDWWFKHNPEYFRFHVGGEVPDRTYRDGVLDTVKSFDTHTWMYTKEYEMWNEIEALPKNLVVMYSEWDGLPMDNPHNRPMFRVRFKGKPVPDGCTWKCPGNCDICRAAHRGCVVGESTWVDEH